MFPRLFLYFPLFLFKLEMISGLKTCCFLLFTILLLVIQHTFNRLFYVFCVFYLNFCFLKLHFVFCYFVLITFFIEIINYIYRFYILYVCLYAYAAALLFSILFWACAMLLNFWIYEKIVIFKCFVALYLYACIRFWCICMFVFLLVC